MLMLLITLVKEVIKRVLKRESPKPHVSVQVYFKDSVSVQAYLAKHGIGAGAITVTVEHLEEKSDDHVSDFSESSDRYIHVQAYLEKHGVTADAISLSGVE